MMYQVFVLTAIFAVASARPQEHHGHAFSSQSIVLHGAHALEPHHHALATLSHHHHAAPLYQHHDQHHIDYYAHPQYAFDYKIEDPHTGDKKYQHETRDGDVVKGVYSLHEPDGTIRIVEYSADKHSGFNAIVRREGHAQHIQPEHHIHY